MKMERVNGTNQRRGSQTDPRTQFFQEQPMDLSDARVAVLGCGSVGSFAALALASAGVGHLLLADCDRLSKDNIRRHVCATSDIGSLKTHSLGAALCDRYPSLDVRMHDDCFLNRPGQLRKPIARCEAVLVAVDSESAKYLINDMVWHLGCPAVFAGVYGGGWGGEMILVASRLGTPCYGCSANALGRFGIEPSEREDVPAYAMASRQGVKHGAAGKSSSSNGHADPPRGGSANAWVQASLTSILPVAGMTADLVTALLAAHRGADERVRDFVAEGAFAWRLAIRRVAAWSLGPWSLEPVFVSGNTACPNQCTTPDKVAA